MAGASENHPNSDLHSNQSLQTLFRSTIKDYLSTNFSFGCVVGVAEELRNKSEEERATVIVLLLVQCCGHLSMLESSCCCHYPSVSGLSCYCLAAVEEEEFLNAVNKSFAC
ncbi:hypothetical protein HN51_070268 [Arachis hypogaea]